MMLETDKFKPLTGLIEGTVITLYESYSDLYKDNSEFNIIQRDGVPKKLPRLFYINYGNKYKICGIKSDVNNFMNSI